jgi:hypothetical protein
MIFAVKIVHILLPFSYQSWQERGNWIRWGLMAGKICPFSLLEKESSGEFLDALEYL